MNALNYDRQKFGKDVRTHRGAINGHDFAKQVGISRAILARVERGSAVEDWIIHKICKLIDVKITDFPSGRAGNK